MKLVLKLVVLVILAVGTSQITTAQKMFAKVLVVAHVPNESVTVRWQVISNNETAKRD